MNKDYTPKYLIGYIGVRFLSHEDFSSEPIDNNGNFVIDYQRQMEDDGLLLSYFENKYDIKLSKEEHDYFYIFECAHDTENEIMCKISHDPIVNHCSLIDERKQKALEVGKLIEDANEMFLLSEELESKSDEQINNNIDYIIKLAFSLRT